MNDPRPSRILATDDDGNLIRLLAESLEGAGYDVMSATNGLDGIKQLYTNRPDLVILDVMMPRMDGWETLNRIREMSDVPVIMLTARDAEADRNRDRHGDQRGHERAVDRPEAAEDRFGLGIGRPALRQQELDAESLDRRPRADEQRADDAAEYEKDDPSGEAGRPEEQSVAGAKAAQYRVAIGGRGPTSGWRRQRCL